MELLLGTKSELKLHAIQKILARYGEGQPYQIETEDIPSQVPHTPFNDQTYEGAKNRAYTLHKEHQQEYDLYIGVESGLVERENNLFEECWCVIFDKDGKEYVGYSSGFMLPQAILERMHKGEAHSDIMAEMDKEMNLQQKDTWAIYSQNRLKRNTSIQEAFRNAFLSINT